MNGRWEKLGLLYSPSGVNGHPKLRTHASNPTAVHLADGVYRVFFGGRDRENRSSVGAVDIDIERRHVLNEVTEPIFLHGGPGTFYEYGISPGCVYSVGATRYMLFMGWQRPPGGHWRGDIGRLILGDDLSLRIDPSFAVMSCDPVDTLSLSYPWVEGPDGISGLYRMWYGSTIKWDKPGVEMVHVLNTAVSTDGHRWIRRGLAVPYIMGTAQAFSRPTVARLPDGRCRMWFSYRGNIGTTYRIGSALEEPEGRWSLDLHRNVIGVSDHGWDSGMVEYPCVLRHKGEYFMLYNGDGYGATGIGLAALRFDGTTFNG